MDESSISVRYARALFEVAEERDILIALKNDMKLIANVCNTSADFMRLLNNPVVKASQKIHIVSLIFKGKVEEITLDFLKLIIKNNREIFIPAVCRNILSFIKEARGIKTIILTTATNINEASLDNIGKIMEKELGSQVEISARINPGIIGGMILRIDDKQYDASIAAQLNKIKKELLAH
jgi:F-type H+-transporting ATPase subunit delta